MCYRVQGPAHTLTASAPVTRRMDSYMLAGSGAQTYGWGGGEMQSMSATGSGQVFASSVGERSGSGMGMYGAAGDRPGSGMAMVLPLAPFPPDPSSSSILARTFTSSPAASRA